MKTFLKYDLKIQQTVILLFISTVLMELLLKQKCLFTILIVEFFLIAFFQYSLNIIKFYDSHYVRTGSRKVYIFTSTYIVISFLIWMFMPSLPLLDNNGIIKSIFEYVIISWMMLSPVLILQSLSISFSDEETIKKSNT